jgi:hypothetical protein
MTNIQGQSQCDGPHRPTAKRLVEIIKHSIPAHCEIKAISINGQTGTVFIETTHEELEQVWERPVSA